MRFPLLLCITVLSLAPRSVSASTVSEPATGFTLTVSPEGKYLITIQNSSWVFGGNVPGPLQQLRQDSGTDGIGKYDEISFQFRDGIAVKQGGIRVYQQKPAILFTLTYLARGENSRTFPDLVYHPTGLFHMTNSGWEQHFNLSTTDGPLVEFDANAHAFILSPASNFVVASTWIGRQGDIASGVDSVIPWLPAGFSQRTLLVADQGINRAFDTWGHALTDLEGKVRPSNEADITLSHLGYWTDNGARYYYAFSEKLGYEKTLVAIRDEFQAKGVPLGYVQLDSWFYPKGAAGSWMDHLDGIYKYEASPQLFRTGLEAFQDQIRLPLVTHARWIDDDSPYRHEYRMSNNVSTDPRYWNMVMKYLSGAGGTTYEQDWLATYAQTDINLSDPDAFLNEMARAAAERGLTIQYCQPRASDYLQASKYNNVTSIRTSPDRFSERWWDRFLYGSRLASAMGIWPWTDVFMSAEADNLLLATLSAGPVGVGDPLGAVDAESLLRAVRKDGVIVKPDVPLVPTDQTVLNDAQGLEAPMIAATYTDFGSVKMAYVFAHPRGSDTRIAFQPNSLGLRGRVYVYNYFTKSGQAMDADATFSDRIAGRYGYYIVTPVSTSGIALLGDTRQFVPMGRQRIAQVQDDGEVEVTVNFAAGEAGRVIEGYSIKPPTVTAETGTAGAVKFDTTAKRFRFSVGPDGAGIAVVRIAAN